jgi:hypothetical protein
MDVPASGSCVIATFGINGANTSEYAPKVPVSLLI